MSILITYEIGCSASFFAIRVVTKCNKIRDFSFKWGVERVNSQKYARFDVYASIKFKYLLSNQITWQLLKGFA